MPSEQAPAAPTFERTGLTSQQVEESREKHGANLLTPPERDPLWKQFLEKFDDPVIRILVIAAVLAILVGISDGHYVEGIGIILAILLATGLAFLNEYRANKAFDILNQTNDNVPVKAIRDGSYVAIPRRDVVVGDILVVEGGEEIVADCEVLEAVSLEVDQAALTGETVAVSKWPVGKVPPGEQREGEALPLDRAYRGTFVADGRGVLHVVAVGDATLAGETARRAAEAEEEITPLNVQLERLSKLIGVVGFGFAGGTFAALFAHGLIVGTLVLTGVQWAVAALLFTAAMLALVRIWLPVVYDGVSFFKDGLEAPEWLEEGGWKGWALTVGGGLLLFAIGLGILVGLGQVEAAPATWLPFAVVKEVLGFFMVAVTLIVVAVPEGLAMAVTLSLAYSMRKMTAQNNLVRKMKACETVGAATVICSDKTGTLTRNEMSVREWVVPSLPDPAALGAGEAGRLLVEAIAGNSTANLGKAEGGRQAVLGNPTEGALLRWLSARGQDYLHARDAFPICQQWTFKTERKFMATLGRSSLDGADRLHVKGAPEIVLGRCESLLTPQGRRPIELADRAAIAEQLAGFQSRGMRTLGFAFLESPHGGAGVAIEELAVGMTWLGFAALEDPIRPEVPAAIETCARAGVKVKVVTGDNAETAKEIARQLSLWREDEPGRALITGPDFAALSHDEALAAVGELKILARARPMDKLRLVELLQERSEVVAVTGDGTNDAPALNKAQVGLAMGSGTAVAKEASDIILLDDSFGSIAKAILWGRSLYENIQRFILFQLTINVVALGIVFLGPFIGVDLPLTVTQMLWVNLIMDTFAALALATEPPNPEVMGRPPRDPAAFILTRPMVKEVLVVGLIFLALCVVFIKLLEADGVVTRKEETLFFASFVFLQFWNIFNARCLGKTSSAFRGLLENKSFLLIVGAILVGTVLMVQVGGEVFRTAPLSALEWIVIIGATSLVLAGGELRRLLARLGERG